MKSFIADLEEQVEYWRQRAENAEQMLRGTDWDVSIPPLTLYETRLMRLLARRPYTPNALAFAMGLEYERTSIRCIYIAIHRIRAKLPERIAPSGTRQYSAPYEVPDRAALKAFLTIEAEDERAAA